MSIMAKSPYKTWLMLAALAVPAAGCMRLGSGGAPLTGGQSSGKGILAAMGQGLLGRDAAALSAADKKQALMAEYKALEYNKAGQAVSWRGANGQASGTVSPGQPYRVGAQNCRQYSHDWQINGVPHMARGSACRNANGSWTPLT